MKPLLVMKRLLVSIKPLLSQPPKETQVLEVLEALLRLS